MRGDVQFDPPFIESGGVTFSGGLRLANREIDYEFGRYLADYSGEGELNGSAFGQNWTPFGYFQDGAIGYKSCEIPASAGANFQFAPCERFGNSPALITPYQTFTGTAGRVETINGFWSSGHAGTSSVLVQNRSQMSNALAWIQGLYPDTDVLVLPVAAGNLQGRRENHIGLPDGRRGRSPAIVITSTSAPVCCGRNSPSIRTRPPIRTPRSLARTAGTAC